VKSSEEINVRSK